MIFELYNYMHFNILLSFKQFIEKYDFEMHLNAQSLQLKKINKKINTQGGLELTP